MFIAKYDEGSIFNHDEYRERKLLLHKKEIYKLGSDVTQNGYTLIPLKVYIKGSHAKVLVGVCRGKKLYDKRESIKKRDLERESRRYYEIKIIKKNYYNWLYCFSYFNNWNSKFCGYKK